MPREMIQPRHEGDPFHVKVGWDRNGSVQVGVAGAPLTIDGKEFDSVWSDLDRQGCNNLIRVLRRARDAAFGRDE